MPSRRLSERTKDHAHTLRREMTDAEARLWRNLRGHNRAGKKFRIQHPFGPYILDFYCAEARLIVEVDGGQHFDTRGLQRDAARPQFLEAKGLVVLRVSNLEALTQTDAVLESILRAVEQAASPSP